MTTRRHFLTLAATAAPCRFLTAETPPSLEAVLSDVVRGYMEERKIPGGQLALARGGKIEFSKGLGLADREKKTAVEPRTLFRIASLSKPLTSVATLMLAEEGKLALDATVMEVLKPDIFLPKGRTVDARVKDITIRHLLQHTGGWNRDKSGDVMFESLKIAQRLGVESPPGPKDVIREALGRPLDAAPGTKYVYSNFGFCILGRIIELVGGVPYEQFVKERVLLPLGITAPKIGATLTQAEGEARYYIPAIKGVTGTGDSVFPSLKGKVPTRYGAWCLETMDSHGGWIACAEDMVRFIMSLEDVGGTSPFKKRETWETLIAPPAGLIGHDKDGKPLPTYYGCGFRVIHSKNGTAINHTGSLSGTATFLWRRADGTSWATFFNQRNGGTRDKAIVETMNKALDASGSI